jgi:small subunit ribosomal protein S20
MANHKSALKAHAKSLQRREHNRQLRSRMRHALTAARGAIDDVAAGDSTGDGDAVKAREAIRSTVALIDTLAGKGVIHQNAAGRHKARLSKRLEKATAAA